MTKTLIYRLGSLGDTLIALPVFHLIRHRFPQTRVTVLTNSPVHKKAAALGAVLANTGLIDDIIDYPIGLRDPKALRDLRARLRAEQFQLAVHLAAPRGLLASVRDYLFFRSCGIPCVVGVPWRRFDLRCVRLADGSYEWEASRLARRVAALGQIDLVAQDLWDLRFTESELAVADELLRRNGIPHGFLAASIGTKVDAKDWTESNWNELIRQLGRRIQKRGLVLIGSADERERSERASAHWHAPRANLCGLTPPRVSAAILKQAALFVGHDSGPMHLAATVGTPCVAIFSARNWPGQWFPRGKQNTILYHKTDCCGCGLEVCTEQQKKCILSITVQEVFDAVMAHLASAFEANIVR